MEKTETGAYEGLARRDAWAARLLLEYRQTGDVRLRDEVYANYTPLTRITANRIAHPAQEREDVIQEACIGLFIAIEEWNPEKGHRFSTWAIAKMRYACVEYARRVIWGTRSMQAKLQTAQRRLTAIENGEPMTTEELQNGGPVMPATAALAPLSLDNFLRTVNEDNDTERYLRDQITDQINCEFAALQNILHEQVKAGLAWLPERERRVFQLYYQQGKTFREIGNLLGVSESRAFQLHGQGIMRLRLKLKGSDEPGPATLPYSNSETAKAPQSLRAGHRNARRRLARIAV